MALARTAAESQSVAVTSYVQQNLGLRGTAQVFTKIQ
jgi:hypothetical protein